MKFALEGLFRSKKRAARSVEADEIRAWLVREVAERLHRREEDIDVDASLLEYGLDSLQATAISGGLERLIGRRISPAAIWDHPTIHELAAHLAAQTPAGEETP